MVLVLRVLPLADNKKSTETLGGVLSITNLKAIPHSDTPPPIRTYPFQQSPKIHLLIVTLPTTLWEPITFKPIQCSIFLEGG